MQVGDTSGGIRGTEFQDGGEGCKERMGAQTEQAAVDCSLPRYGVAVTVAAAFLAGVIQVQGAKIGRQARRVQRVGETFGGVGGGKVEPGDMQMAGVQYEAELGWITFDGLKYLPDLFDGLPQFGAFAAVFEPDGSAGFQFGQRVAHFGGECIQRILPCGVSLLITAMKADTRQSERSGEVGIADQRVEEPCRIRGSGEARLVISEPCTIPHSGSASEFWLASAWALTAAQYAS